MIIIFIIIQGIYFQIMNINVIKYPGNSQTLASAMFVCNVQGVPFYWYQILEQDMTVNDQSNAGRFDPEVFFNCMQLFSRIVTSELSTQL